VSFVARTTLTIALLGLDVIEVTLRCDEERSLLICDMKEMGNCVAALKKPGEKLLPIVLFCLM
jgi:hypothetical protein